MEASTFQSNSLQSGSSFKSPQMKSGISHHWHWNTLSEFSDFLMKRHADCQERNLPPGSSLAMYPECTPRASDPWILNGCYLQGSPEAEMNMYLQGKVISIFQKKHWIPGCQSSQLYSTQIEKKKWRKLKLKPSLLWWILYDLWDVYCSDEVKYFLRSSRSYMNHQHQKIQL